MGISMEYQVELSKERQFMNRQKLFILKNGAPLTFQNSSIAMPLLFLIGISDVFHFNGLS